MDVGPGDRVICVNAGVENGWSDITRSLVQGEIYTVEWAGRDRDGDFVLRLVEIDHEAISARLIHVGFLASRFRKVQRRSISEWLETSTGYEEPRRVPAPREVEGV